MKTLEEVLENFESNTIDGRDAHRLAEFLKEDQLHLIGVTLKEGTDIDEYNSNVLEWNEENVMKQIANDVEFGFEKALNQRGLSAGMMTEVVLMWARILEEQSVLNQEENYAQYGLPIFKAAALAWELKNEIGDDVGNENKYSSEGY